MADTAVLSAAASKKQNIMELTMIAQELVQPNLPDDAIIDVNFTDMSSSRSSSSRGSKPSKATEPGLRVELSYIHQPVIAGILGMGKDMLKVKAVSEAALIGNKKLNIALVLDTTLSMEGERLDALKEASSDLITHLENLSTESGDVKVSVVPFSDYVRIDPDLRGEFWLNAQEDQILDRDIIDDSKSTGCVEELINEKLEKSCTTTVYRPKSEPASWVGCMGSRKDGYHTEVKYMGRQMQGPAGRTLCNRQNNIMQPLSDNLSAVKSTIDDFRAVGQTYMPAGLIWGWRTLDPSLPFSESANDDTETKNLLILMTDGSNTTALNGVRSEFDGIYHWGFNDETKTADRANELTVQLCDSIKLNNIEILTVAFGVTDQDTLKLLQGCASDLGNYYSAMDSDRLIASFNNIGAELGQVRLTR